MNEEPRNNFFEHWRLSAFVIISVVVFGAIIFAVENNSQPSSQSVNQNSVGTTANQNTKFYYINSNGICVLAPHNPYSGNDQEFACYKDVGQFCYNDSTCGGVGRSDTVVIKGESFRISTAKELIQNVSTPGFAEDTGDTKGNNTASMIAVKGTLTGIFPESGGNGTYDLAINTGDGYVVVMQGTIDPNTKASNGFIPSNLSVGTKLIASGVFMGNTNNFNLGTLTKVQDPSVPIADPQLANLNLPANTPILISGGTNGVQSQKGGNNTTTPVTNATPALAPATQTTPKPVTIVPPTTVTDYSQFTPTYFYNFAGDPPAYLGISIKVKGTINNEFLAAGDKGGSSNYIGIADWDEQRTNTMMLKITNNTNYQKAVSALRYGDLVAVYGSGAASEYFTSNSGQKTLVPIINVVRLDVIGVSGVDDGSVTTVFP